MSVISLNNTRLDTYKSLIKERESNCEIIDIFYNKYLNNSKTGKRGRAIDASCMRVINDLELKGRKLDKQIQTFFKKVVANDPDPHLSLAYMLKNLYQSCHKARDYHLLLTFLGSLGPDEIKALFSKEIENQIKGYQAKVIFSWIDRRLMDNKKYGQYLFEIFPHYPIEHQSSLLEKHAYKIRKALEGRPPKGLFGSDEAFLSFAITQIDTSIEAFCDLLEVLRDNEIKELLLDPIIREKIAELDQEDFACFLENLDDLDLIQTHLNNIIVENSDFIKATVDYIICDFESSAEDLRTYLEMLPDDLRKEYLTMEDEEGLPLIFWVKTTAHLKVYLSFLSHEDQVALLSFTTSRGSMFHHAQDGEGVCLMAKILGSLTMEALMAPNDKGMTPLHDAIRIYINMEDPSLLRESLEKIKEICALCDDQTGKALMEHRDHDGLRAHDYVGVDSDVLLALLPLITSAKLDDATVALYATETLSKPFIERLISRSAVEGAFYEINILLAQGQKEEANKLIKAILNSDDAIEFLKLSTESNRVLDAILFEHFDKAAECVRAADLSEEEFLPFFNKDHLIKLAKSISDNKLQEVISYKKRQLTLSGWIERFNSKEAKKSYWDGHSDRFFKARQRIAPFVQDITPITWVALLRKDESEKAFKEFLPLLPYRVIVTLLPFLEEGERSFQAAFAAIAHNYPSRARMLIEEALKSDHSHEFIKRSLEFRFVSETLVLHFDDQIKELVDFENLTYEQSWDFLPLLGPESIGDLAIDCDPNLLEAMLIYEESLYTVRELFKELKKQRVDQINLSDEGASLGVVVDSLSKFLSQLSYKTLLTAICDEQLCATVGAFIPFMTSHQLNITIPFLSVDEFCALFKKAKRGDRKTLLKAATKEQAEQAIESLEFVKNLSKIPEVRVTQVQLALKELEMLKKGVGPSMANAFEPTIKTLNEALKKAQEAIKVEEEPPEEYLDLVTLEMMENPRRMACGHILDKSTIDRLNTCPFDRSTIDKNQLQPVIDLKDKIDAWKNRDQV